MESSRVKRRFYGKYRLLKLIIKWLLSYRERNSFDLARENYEGFTGKYFDEEK